VVVGDFLKHHRCERIRIDACSFRQKSEVIAGRCKKIADAATAVVDELHDRGVQFDKFPEQIERKIRILTADGFDDHCPQSIKLGDYLAASLVRWHRTQLAEAGEALAHAGPETFWALLGRDGQLNGLFQLLVSGRPCQQQLGKPIGAQLSQSRDRDLALSRHGSICGIEREVAIGYTLSLFSRGKQRGNCHAIRRR